MKTERWKEEKTTNGRSKSSSNKVCHSYDMHPRCNYEFFFLFTQWKPQSGVFFNVITPLVRPGGPMDGLSVLVNAVMICKPIR